MARRLSFCCLLLFAFAGSTVAQNDPQYVIKRRTDAGSSEIHYLAHVKVGDNWVLQDATTFSPNCVWYSGNTFDQAGVNHNYYFIDEGVYHFLYAPLTPKSPLHLSDSIPSAQLLRNSEQNYYFWDWDWDNKPIDGAGLTRGVERTGVSQVDCGFGWGGGECWEAYWVEYNNDVEGQWGWRLSSSSHYTINNPADPVPGAARFRKVTVIPHDIVVTEVTEGELDDLADFTLDAVGAYQGLTMSASTYSYSYIPAYTTYVFEGGTHNYFNNLDQGEATPAATTGTGTPSTYTWTITGPGAEFLSFSSTPGSNVTTFEGASSTLYYSSLNETGHKTATLTITVTYTSGITQVRTATITVKTPCGNPLPVGDPVVVYDYVTVSWVNTADQYKVYWKKDSESTWNDSVVSGVSSFTFRDLAYSTPYHYKVAAYCSGVEITNPAPTAYPFTTMPEPELLIYGSVFGGGRMADVNGNTEVVIINCDTIGAVYGGNDIAGSVLGLGGSNVILGIDASSANDSYAQLYNGGQASTKVRVNDVYGGGNGYYSYNGTSFEAATADYPTVTIAPDASVTTLSSNQQWDEPVWTNNGSTSVELTIPSIVKAAITVSNDQVKVDSLFGGAKNAFLTHIVGYDAYNKPVYSSIGDTIAINGGTILAVYGGNNIGGSQGYGRHRIHVTNTTTYLDDSIRNTVATGFGRDFGIRYLFGGGNKVAGSTTDVTIVGGQLDTIFGGGNEADVYAANIEVNCEFGSYSSQHPYIYGAAYSNAINSAYYTQHYTNTNPASFNDVKMIDTVNYEWNGFGGIYNVRTLFGGSNQAAMNGVPTVRLISGSIGTVYGGGNAGDMLSHGIDSICLPEDTLRFKYGTHVVMNDPTVLVDYLYGGCQVSNVDFSTWVEIQNGHVGYVYGGCNVSGDVGSTRINTELPPLDLDDPTVTPQQKRDYCLEYQQVQGATYVVASGGIIYKNLFAGSNGYYHCNDNVTYIQGSVTYGDWEGKYLGLTIPTHNETHAVVRPGAYVRGNVYAGGNLACVGFTTQTVGNMSVGFKPFPDKMVGLASVRMDGGTVDGDVYGGGNMASIFGSNEVQVSGGTIGGALYGGNDKLGMVAQPTNRALPDKYFLASDGNTPLTDVKTYVSVTGRPEINTVYGGGNGDYVYTSDLYCDPENLPIQRDIFVDINIDGYPDEDGHQGGHIQTVYGGGNGVTVLGKTTVFLNVKGGENGEEPIAYDHVDTIFGGNNKGHLNILADIILLKGQVNTVYGGCNKGAMLASKEVTGIDNTTYTNVGSVVRLRDRYIVTNTVPATPVMTTTKTTGRVSGTVYGGCRMNGVNNNSLVLVEGGIHGKNDNAGVFQYATIYAGSDISGDVGGLGKVVISNGTYQGNVTQVGDVYGGGNGNYTYTGAYSGLRAPYCDTTHVEIKGGTVNNLYAGGYAGQCGGTTMQVDGGTVNNRVFGGGNMAGLTTSNLITTTAVDTHGNVTITTNETTTWGTSTLTVNGGEVKGGIFGGDNLADSIAGPINVYIYGGTLGSDADHPMADGIFGGGFGVNTGTLDNVTVTIGGTVGEQSYAPTIYGNVYGGSALGQVNGPESSPFNLTKVDFLNGNLYGKLYGGGMGDTSDSALVNGNVQVNIIGGNLYRNVYGGCDYKGGVTGDIAVNVKGGQVGVIGTSADVFGGGYGHSTATSGNVTVTVDKLNGGTAPVIYGDVYGGSGYGDVNSPKEASNNSSDDITTVDILNGTISGNVYGGGLGDGNNPAHVNGKVYVNVGRGQVNSVTGCHEAISGDATIGGSVYGCNNVNGTPLDSVFVNIIKTHHGGTIPSENAYPINIAQAHDDGDPGLDDDTNITIADLEYNYKPVDDGGQGQTFALLAVYGGGNRAAYLPLPTNDNKPRCTTVHVWDCQENTIDDIYGGGNAANVGDTTDTGERIPVNTRVIIDGGRIHRMFGGGNGYSATGNHNNPSAANYNPGANIYGTASSFVYAGLIDQVYGGANQYGSIDVIDLNVLSSGCCRDAAYGMVFGCANEAPINHSIVTTIGCGVGEIGDLYGGSNLASIGVDNQNKPKANVTLNIYGGDYERVFAGSRGRIGGGGESAVAADIYGDVTLNLYGGKIIDAFGGSDQNGNIKGVITVNVLDEEICHLDLTNVYGGSKLADYEPWLVNGAQVQSPIVNVMHIHNVDVVSGQEVMKGIRGNVFGGGYKAEVRNSNPVVNIGYEADTVVYGTTTMANLKPSDYPQLSTLTDFPHAYISGSVFGGGDEAPVFGQSTVNIRQASSETRMDKVFGGGNKANVDTTMVNVYNGTVVSGIYGGCNETGDITHDVFVNIYGGTLGTATDAKMSDGIYGGGLGYQTSTSGNNTVTIKSLPNHTAPTIYADVYGGSAFGEVGAAGKLAKVDLKNGTVYGKIFGGGKGDGTHSATVTGNAELAINGSVLDSIFGGCNVNGVVKGNTLVNILDNGVLGAAAVQSEGGNKPEIRANVYGGGLGEYTKVIGNVDVTVNGNTAIIYGDVYGGSAKGLVNCNEAGNGANSGSKTDVTLENGTIHGDLYGGGHGPENKIADVWGPLAVEINGGTVDNVYGGNNLKGTPKNTITVTVNDGTCTNVYGGGNVADYTSPVGSGSTILYSPYVHIAGGSVLNMVVGGGNLANVNGNTKVELTGGIVGSEDHDASVFGGGYGQGTGVSGNVLVIFGDDTDLQKDYPLLYGELYGGSALGNVNTGESNTTTVYLLNGTIDGAAYGGGLGQKSGVNGAQNDVEALVNGVVHVYVGKAEDPDDENTFIGQATLIDCDVYGCNNLNGSPQQDVYVDVFKTAHNITNTATYLVNDGEHGNPTYAIHEVIGGGNRADYAHTGKMNIVYVHKCDNTVKRLFGGGNAAAVYGVDLTIDGGRFDEVFGGGNGEVTPANIGAGGITILLGGGHINMLVNGSNDQGTVSGEIHSTTMPEPVCNDTEIIDYFLGNNQTDLFEDITTTIRCGTGNNGVEMRFVNLYCGSNVAQIYANINVTIEGGIFENVFGGSKGRKDDPNGLPDYSSDIHVIKQQDILEHPGHGLVEGEGGNINLLIKGGTIGNLYGGCDVYGNVEGKIDIEVYSVESADCPLFIGNIYGAGNKTDYTPDNANGVSPMIKILKGEIGGRTYDLPVYNPDHLEYKDYPGNVYGGGHEGNVTSNPKVIVGNGTANTPVSIEGNVFGGGYAGNVVGSPKVIVVPETHTLTVIQSTGGVVKVTNSINENMLNDSNVATIGEDLDVKIEAESADGYEFVSWEIVNGGDGTIANTSAASTTFTMRKQPTTIKANFRQP